MQLDEIKSPEWINNSFLQKAIQSYKKDDSIKVLDFNLNGGSSEHFCSTMFKCKIEFTSLKYPKTDPETLRVMIKAKPVDEDLKMNIVSGGPYFETEIKMYSETIPAMQKLFEASRMKVELGPE
jgi:Ecdysteroid kinase-like family